MKKSFFSLPFLILLLASCSKSSPAVDDKKTNQKVFTPTKLPDGVEQLFDAGGDKDQDTVWVFLQGGPDVKKNFELEAEATDQDYDFFLDDYRVYPVQTQQLNESLKTAENFSFDDSKKESELNAKIVKDVVQHFKDQQKVVYLIGHSYGAFLLQKVLADYGNIADANAVLNGRLAMEEVVWKNFKDGKFVGFDNKGENPTVQEITEELLKKEGADASLQESKNNSIYGSYMISLRYLDLLKDVDLSKTLFIGAQNDAALGDWTTEEYQFLQKKAGKVYFGDGNYSSIFDYDGMKSVQLFLIGKSPF